MGLVLRLFLLLAVGVGSASAEDEDTEAKRLYIDGKQAYEEKRFAAAVELFRESYLRSKRPELLFNMATALEAFDRPHDAAEALRSYLRVRPEEAERPALEIRIRGLEEAQHLLDVGRGPVTTTTLALPKSPSSPRRSRRGLVVGLAVGGVALGLLAGGLAIGLTVGRPGVAYTETPLGDHAATK